MPVTYLLCVKCGFSKVGHTVQIPGACNSFTERTELEIFNEKENHESQNPSGEPQGVQS